MTPRIDVSTVRGPADLRAFTEAARVAESGNPRWVEPAGPYIDALLGPRSPVLAENEVGLFVARIAGRPVGRIAAIVNRAHLAKYADGTGQFGLFETVDDRAVTEALFEAAFAFLRQRGLRRVTGPFSLTINHETGLLVDGFEEPHVVHTNHAPPWYGAHLEAMGFTKAMDVQSWVVRLADTDFPARVERAAARIPGAAAIRTEGVTPLNWASRTGLINAMYNDIWAENWGSIPVSATEGGMIARLTLPTSHLSWLRLAYHGAEPIALLTQIPDTNEALQGLDGRMLPFGWSRMLWRIHGRGTRMTRVPMFGLKKAWHRTRLGTLAANRLMAEAMLQARKAGAAEMEISWILETNTVFLNMVAGLPARRTRTFRVYERPL